MFSFVEHKFVLPGQCYGVFEGFLDDEGETFGSLLKKYSSR